MYSLKNRTINNRPIEKFEVWFQVPFAGLMRSIDDAIQACLDQDLNPDMCVVSVPVAIAEEGDYEVIIR